MEINTDENYLNLANAVVELWADDYRKAVIAYKAGRYSKRAKELYHKCVKIKKGLISKWGNLMSRGLSEYITQEIERKAGVKIEVD